MPSKTSLLSNLQYAMGHDKNWCLHKCPHPVNRNQSKPEERVRRVFFCLDLWSVLLFQTMQSPITTTTKHLHPTKQTRNKKNDKKNVLDKSFSVSICDLCCFFKRCNHQSPQQQNTYILQNRHETKKNDKKNVLDKSFSVSICDLCCSFKRCNHQSPQQQNTYSLQNRHETKKTTKRTC